MRQDNYCIGCKLRLHNRADKPNFCAAGYTQVALTYEATIKVLENGGRVCDMNKWKSAAIAELREVA